MPRRALALISLLLCLAACEPRPQRRERPAAQPSPGVTINGIVYPCPEVAFEATHLINGVAALPEHGPVDELGSFADLVWTAPHEGRTGRVIVMELYIGWTHYAIGNPLAVVVRGVQGSFGSVEDGFGLEWRVGAGRCDFFHLELFGNTTRDELVRFAEGLRRTA